MHALQRRRLPKAEAARTPSFVDLPASQLLAPALVLGQRIASQSPLQASTQGAKANAQVPARQGLL